VYWPDDCVVSSDDSDYNNAGNIVIASGLSTDRVRASPWRISYCRVRKKEETETEGEYAKTPKAITMLSALIMQLT
jgi:hypothetical protein